MLPMPRRVAVAGLLLCCLSVSLPLPAQSLSAAELLQVLRAGGNVIVMRHASSPRTLPDKAEANPDNTALERQLDSAGRTSAAKMGKALRELKIPVGEVLSSSTYRALETAKFAQLRGVKTYPELGDGGQSMALAGNGQGTWLQQQVTQLPPAGSNTFIITHLPNISAAFPEAHNAADGEALVFGADGKGGSALLARIKIDEWPELGKR